MNWMAIGAGNGLFAVAAGAFGAHALKSKLDAASLNTFEVGVRYQMYHALALLAVAWVVSTNPSRAANASGYCFLIGTVLFSGSIYGLALTPWRWLGPITPLGGTVLMAGWLFLIVAALRNG